MKKEQILVVDDEVEICLLLSGMLKKLGFQTTYAHSVEEGAKKIKANKYDLVFLDLNLPDGLGFHLIPKVLEENKDSKVIIISAYDGNIERQRATAEGADFFIPKPFNKKMIMDALEELHVTYSS
ncbi:response regulator [Fulvivirga maritima]|uniref:response regulator n=1 Tax=Fulvivirga maritima TaxID=2904247 RepID=UPI001F297D0E|nr:response regulator [Fulvivirga maritima]UII26465.1 response regulator [Fulvivirga maritima]